MEEQLRTVLCELAQREQYEGVTLYEGRSTEACINTLHIQPSAGSLWQTHALRVRLGCITDWRKTDECCVLRV